MKKFVLALLAATAFLLTAAAQEAAPEVRVWPWLKTIHLPTDLEQFLFLELPAPGAKAPLTVTMTLPDGIAVTGFPKGESPAVPPASISIFPEKFQQKGNIAEFQFAENAFQKNAAYLSMQLLVKSKPGKYLLTLRITAGDWNLQQEIPVEVFPALHGLQPKKITISAYDYPGLAAEFLPTYLGMLKASGINDLLHMRGDYDRPLTATDRAKEYGIRNGLVFFLHQIKDYFTKNPLPDGILRGCTPCC